MTKVYKLKEIEEVLPEINLFREIEQGFIEYSSENTVVPPIGELLFERPPGDVHIKYGYIKNDEYYVVKIASGFYENPKVNLPSNNGLMILFSQKTGEPLAVMLDQGLLTDVRTAVAGAIAAKYLAPTKIKKIGIVGTGVQARLQLLYLKDITPSKEVIVWGRDNNHVGIYITEMRAKGYHVEAAMDIEELCEQCNLIITTTPVLSPLIRADNILPGTHITAVGSDTEDKQEIQTKSFAKADLIVADSISQCNVRGEIHHALKKKVISLKQVKELGDVIQDRKLQRSNDNQTSIADLTGVAVQDIQITKAVYQYFNQ